MVVSTCNSPARRADLGAHGSDQRCSNFVLQCGDPKTGELPGAGCPKAGGAAGGGGLAGSVRRRGDRNACLQRAAQRRWRLNAARVATHRLSATRYFGPQCSTMKLNYGVLPPALLRTGGCSPPITSSPATASCARPRPRRGRRRHRCSCMRTGPWARTRSAPSFSRPGFGAVGTST